MRDIAAEIEKERVFVEPGEPTIYGPDEGGNYEIRWEPPGDGHASVSIHLMDTGDVDDCVFDVEMIVGNADNVSLITMLATTQACVQKFYDLGLDKRFGRLVGE